jgi:hypothetical protein
MLTSAYGPATAVLDVTRGSVAFLAGEEAFCQPPGSITASPPGN